MDDQKIKKKNGRPRGRKFRQVSISVANDDYDFVMGVLNSRQEDGLSAAFRVIIAAARSVGVPHA